MIEQRLIPGVDIDTDYLLRLREIVTGTRERRRNLGSLSGAISSARRGRGSILYDVRPWTEGDDIRRLDCYKTARTGVPHIRTTHEDRDNKLLFIADFRPSMHFGTRRALRSVVAAEAISICGWRAIGDYGLVGIVVATSVETKFLGWAHNGYKFSELLAKLAAAHREAKDWKGSYEPKLSEVIEIAQRTFFSARLIIATALDAPGENFEMVASFMARRRDLIFLLISDKFERKPLPGDYPYQTSEGQAGRLQISRRSVRKLTNDWPVRLAGLGAKSQSIHAELPPSEIARILGRLHD